MKGRNIQRGCCWNLCHAFNKKHFKGYFQFWDDQKIITPSKPADDAIFHCAKTGPLCGSWEAVSAQNASRWAPLKCSDCACACATSACRQSVTHTEANFSETTLECLVWRDCCAQLHQHASSVGLRKADASRAARIQDLCQARHMWLAFQRKAVHKVASSKMLLHSSGAALTPGNLTRLRKNSTAELNWKSSIIMDCTYGTQLGKNDRKSKEEPLWLSSLVERLVLSKADDCAFYCL